MAIQTVNTGTTPNDGTGDPARTAFIKINDNFTQAENAASRLIATEAQALAGTPGVLPDSAYVLALIKSFGIGKYGETNDSTIDPATLKQGFYHYARRSDGATPPSWIQNSHYSTLIPFSPASTTLRWGVVYIPNEKSLYLTEDASGTGSDGLFSNPKKFYTTGNTTVDGNGFIKVASPIIELYNNRAESNGSVELKEMQFERIGTGHYRLTGVPELSRDGWYIETPKDRNGNIYFTLDYVETDGQLDIYTYEPDYSDGPAKNGNPVDIVSGRFVSLRFAEDKTLITEEPVQQEGA